MLGKESLSQKDTENKAEKPFDLGKFVDFETLKIKVEVLSEKQKQIAHLVDPRFFKDEINPFRKGKTKEDYKYITPIDLDEELFYIHPFMDPAVLEQGNVRRFPSGVNEKYISEKFFEDRWVSEGNNNLSLLLEKYLSEHVEGLKNKDKIRMLDVGPCGGAITTLFALRALDRVGLLDKVEISMLDIVPNVLEATLLGRFRVPQKLIDEYLLNYAGKEGKNYKDLLHQGTLFGVEEWYNENGTESPFEGDKPLEVSDRNEQRGSMRVKYYRGDGETLPSDIKDYDIVLAGYVHHHMNLVGRKSLCQQMEQATKDSGFIGVADFYVPTYEDYMKWYKPHFEKHGDAPPVECPMVDASQLKSWFQKTKIEDENTINIEKSYIFAGEKLPGLEALK